MLPEAELRWRLEPEDAPGGPPPARTKGPATPARWPTARRRSGNAEHVGNVGRRSRPVSAPHCAPRGGAWDQIHVPVGRKGAGRTPVGGSARRAGAPFACAHTWPRPSPAPWSRKDSPAQRRGRRPECHTSCAGCTGRRSLPSCGSRTPPPGLAGGGRVRTGLMATEGVR